MEIYKINTIEQLIKGNSYVGRGIITGLSEDGKSAVAAYFIMGRSANSRNRIFEEEKGEVFTKPFDVSKVEDPSLIIYAAIRGCNKDLVVTNGDQTDTIVEGMKMGMTFSQALKQRCFEPDAPNLTPRISSILHLDRGYSYEMSILKSRDEEGSGCNRYTFDFEPKAGLGHFIHTYVCDGNPIPTFQGEPERVFIPNDIDKFTKDIWDNLDKDNKISLYVRYIDLKTLKTTNRLINKNK